MLVIYSTVNIEGDLYFINNSAYSQGAMNFQFSTLNVRNNARIVLLITQLEDKQEDLI